MLLTVECFYRLDWVLNNITGDVLKLRNALVYIIELEHEGLSVLKVPLQIRIEKIFEGTKGAHF